MNKENLGSMNAQQRQTENDISLEDREMLKRDIFGALDNVVGMGSEDPKSKVLLSSIENIIYNIA